MNRQLLVTDTGTRTSTSRLAAASAVGTTLEWYDFTVYNTLAALIFNRLFFPSFDPLTGIILAFSTYAVGYISRPLGGVVFGHLGDKLGRRFVLFMTVTIMGVTTALMGSVPTYESIGIMSPILLVTLRAIQGVALGGEWAGAVVISVEHGAQDKRGAQCFVHTGWSGAWHLTGERLHSIDHVSSYSGRVLVVGLANPASVQHRFGWFWSVDPSRRGRNAHVQAAGE